MIHTYITKGEAVLVHSDQSFDIRNVSVRDHFKAHPEVTIYAKEKILIEDVREFIYQIQKEGTGVIDGVEKISVLIFDDIVLPAQQALLKVLEDIDKNACIVLYTHTHSVFIPTVLSRVVLKHEVQATGKVHTYNIGNKTVAERFDMVKAIMKEVEDEKLSKQDVIDIISHMQIVDAKKDAHREIYARAISMLKQPSVSVKYVLEYVVGLV